MPCRCVLSSGLFRQLGDLLFSRHKFMDFPAVTVRQPKRIGPLANPFLVDGATVSWAAERFVSHGPLMTFVTLLFVAINPRLAAAPKIIGGLG